MPRLLELFSGTGSIGRAFAARGWEVVSVDLDPKFQPTICCDVMELDEAALGHFDFVWASPVCTEYSRALTKRPRNLEAGDRLVLRTLEIIQGHHGCFTYTSMLHATASCSKRFCRLICRTLRICAGVRCTGCLGSGSGSGATAGACSG